MSLSFTGELGVITLSSGEYLGLLEYNIGKALSSLIPNFHVDLDSFLLRNEEAHARGFSNNSHTVYILLYCERKDSDAISSFLSEHQLFLQHPVSFDPTTEYHNPQYLTGPGGDIEMPELVSSKFQQRQERSMGQEKDEIANIFETAQGPTVYSNVEPSKRLLTELKGYVSWKDAINFPHLPVSNRTYSHQKKALAMMMEKESGELEMNEFGCLWDVSYGADSEPR